LIFFIFFPQNNILSKQFKMSKLALKKNILHYHTAGISVSKFIEKPDST